MEKARSNLVFNLVNMVGSLCKFTAQPQFELDCSEQAERGRVCMNEEWTLM